MAKKAKKEEGDSGGNYVSEWFGFRVYPQAAHGEDAQNTRQTATCPFLSRATGESRRCIKSQKSLGVCTISTATAHGRRDWLVCPYRALDPTLLNEAAHRLFGVPRTENVTVLPAIRFNTTEEQQTLKDLLADGQRVFLYLDQKLGGEVSQRKTERSPEFSIDVTLLALALDQGDIVVTRYGALEVQTMDFHGSYGAAVGNLKDALRLHAAGFSGVVDQNQQWLREKVEGPNLLNVFKRTVYQMAFKFQLGEAPGCAGCVLAIPRAVWESWRHLLGNPVLEAGEHERLTYPGAALPSPPIAWILAFELETSPDGGPDRVRFSHIIETSAAAIAHWALAIAPAAALEFAGTPDGIVGSIRRRLSFWPELAKNIRL
jgi:hypothetical protein